MKTYTVLYAEDVPHYAFGEIEARSPKAALAKARKMNTDTFTAFEPDWDSSVCRRIVFIEDPAGVIAEDIALDQYHLRNGGDPDRRLCDAAPDMLAALEAQEMAANTIRKPHAARAISTTPATYAKPLSPSQGAWPSMTPRTGINRFLTDRRYPDSLLKKEDR
jgi:hypothetical protein